ncbi:MAG: hypothetical protein WEE89_17305 [Gemmatimonadota bacterium]
MAVAGTAAYRPVSLRFPRLPIRAIAWLAGIIAVAGCSDRPTAPADDPSRSDAVLRGRAAFLSKCTRCHNGDGQDLAFFDFPDSAITRRALAHVDLATAEDINAYIATLRTTPRPRDERLFQPGGAVLANDAVFGLALFGNGELPANLMTAQLRALDRLSVRVAIALPRWSVEGANTDWLPDVPISAAVLADQNSRPAHALDTYRATPTEANLLDAAVALFSALQRDDSPGPCHFESRGLKDPMECFHAARWSATLVAQHMMRFGITRPLPDTSFYNVWWEAGEAMRRAQAAGETPANLLQNQVAWMYLGWMFGPDTRPTLYLLPAIESLGLRRHATWITLSSLVRRPVNSSLPYDDVQNLPRFGYDLWSYGALRIAYTHLLERVQAGDLPPASQRAAARAKLSDSFNEGAAYAGMSAAQKDELRALSQSIVNAIPLN